MQRCWNRGVVALVAGIIGLGAHGPGKNAAQAEPTEHRLLVLPATFTAASHGVAYFRRFSGIGPLCVSRGAGYFTAPVDVPAGSVLTGIRATFQDEAESALGTVALYRLGIATADLLAVTPMSQPRPRSEVVEAAIEPEETVRDTFRYLLHLTLTGPGVCLRSAEVLYRQAR